MGYNEEWEEREMTARKKNPVQPVSPEMAEHAGYKIGDLVYCLVHGKVYRGTITLVHPSAEEPHFSFLDEASVTHRVARFSDIIKSPTAQQEKLVEREIRKGSAPKDK